MCSSFGEADFVGLETRFWPFFGWPLLGEAGLVDFEVLVYFLQWAAFWHLDSGLKRFLFPGNLLTFFCSPCLCFTSTSWGWSLCLGGWADRRCHPRPREERPRGLGPTVVWLSCHNLLYLHWGKSGYPFKATIQSWLSEFQMEQCLCCAWRGELMALSFACANRGLGVCIDATTGSVNTFKGLIITTIISI